MWYMVTFGVEKQHFYKKKKIHHLHWKKRDVICNDNGGTETKAVGWAGEQC